MIRLTVLVILLFAPAAKTQSEDIVSSGEGEESVTSVSHVSRFIDDDGELISRLSTPLSMDGATATATETNIDEAINDNTTRKMEATTEKTPTTTTLAPVTTTSTAAPTTPFPTTTEEITTTSLETTTTTPTTTTFAPETTTTTPKPTTTVRTTRKATTTRRTTRRTTTNPTTKSTTTTVFPAPLETTAASRSAGDVCAFVDQELKCDIEITCYGEGELDCSDTFDGPPSEPSVSNKMVSPTSEDYDDVESETIPTFPPNLVGKKLLPSLFNSGSLGTTEMTSTMLSTTEEKSTEGKDTTRRETTASVVTTTEIQTPPTTTSTTTSTTTTAPTTVAEIVTTAAETESPADSTVKEISSQPTTSDNLTTQNVTMMPEGISEAADVNSELPADDSLRARRRKREEGAELLQGALSSSSARSISSQVAALEGPKHKNRVKTCRIIGNMICSPTPTLDVCRGKSSCQVIAGTSKTSEKATSAKSVVNWTIAVIVMCIIGGILTVSIVVYFVVSSWKKLKVQPQNGVTTLTYVNNTPP